MSKTSHRRWIVILVPVLVAMIVGGVLLFRRSNVEYASPVRESILEAIYGLGRVKARRHYEVKIGVLSTVTRLHVKEGDPVKRGDRLIDLDGNPFKAPFDGTVTSLDASEGETVLPHVPILRVDDPSDQYVEVALEQQAALRVRVGMPARMIFDTVRGERFEGSVSSVFSKNEEFLAAIRVPRFPAGVLPGMTADAVIEVGTKADALLVPLSAVQEGKVLVERGGRRIKVPVEVGIVDGLRAEVVKGDIGTDDRLVVPHHRGKKD
jgi:multidrug efflux pump subunit AcrA (membrane-fusion protein)